MDVIVEKLRRRPVLLYNQALSKQLKEDETGLSQCNVTLTEISLKQNRGAYLNEGFNLSLDYVSTQMTEGSADRSWYSDVRKTFLFLRLTAPLRSRVRVHVFHKCLEILKTKKQMLIRQSKQKVNIACSTYQPLLKKQLQGKIIDRIRFMQMPCEILTSQQNCSLYIPYGAD